MSSTPKDGTPVRGGEAAQPAGQPSAANADVDPASPRKSGGGTVTCDVCGAAMYERHCRILCPRCGYQRDCSDP